MFRTFLLLLGFLTFAFQANAASSLFDEPADTTFLQPDQAFKLSITALDADTLRANLTVAPGHYLYREKISFKLKEGSASQIHGIDLPKGETKHDANFGDSEVFHHSIDATIHLQHAGAAPSSITLLASYQGCSEKGLCYAPIKKTLDIVLPATNQATQPSPITTRTSEQDEVRALLQGGKLWLIAAGFFGFGLLLSFTPCVFPMIPILSGIIVGQGVHPSRLHSFNLSLAYTLGMALAYTLAGVAAGLSGHLISSALQNPWALGFGALIFVLLALSMFGFYELQLPTGLESRVVTFTNRIKGGRFAGVFVMGALSALIVSPCVAAPLAGALLYIGQTHDVVLGGVALFSLSIGMGVPLLLVGASAGTLLPKAGAWMNAVRNSFGVMMLFMAVWLVGPVIPATLQMALYAAILVVSAIYLHAIDSLPPRASAWAKLWKGIGILMLVYGAALLVGALAGSKNPLQPLTGLRVGSVSTSDSASALPFKRIKNLAELDAALKHSNGRFVMLDFYADWCVSCKEYEQYTFRDPGVQKLLKDAVLLQADVTQNSLQDTELLKRFDLFGPPGIAFFDRQGHELKSLKVVGYQDANRFLVSLNSVLSAKDGECAAAVPC
jgi:thiol:disulfide interchange protein DsbD